MLRHVFRENPFASPRIFGVTKSRPHSFDLAHITLPTNDSNALGDPLFAPATPNRENLAMYKKLLEFRARCQMPGAEHAIAIGILPISRVVRFEILDLKKKRNERKREREIKRPVLWQKNLLTDSLSKSVAYIGCLSTFFGRMKTLSSNKIYTSTLI